MIQKFSLPATSDSLQLSGIEVAPDSGEPKGIVQLLHGMCDHKERYLPFMRFLASQGFVCVIHDHRGHGASVRDSSDLGFMYRGGWRAMVDDARAVNAWAHDRHPHLPLALFGHSMGSMVARSYAKRYDDTIDALIVCGCPSYSSAAPVGRLLARAIASLRGRPLSPRASPQAQFRQFQPAVSPRGLSPGLGMLRPLGVGGLPFRPIVHVQFHSQRIRQPLRSDD